MVEPVSAPRPLRPVVTPLTVVPVRYRRSAWRRIVVAMLLLAGLGGTAGAVVTGTVLWQLQRTPREWAPYLQRRAENHRRSIVMATDLVVQWLIRADRPQPGSMFALPSAFGANQQRSGAAPPGRLRLVASPNALREAIASASPGDVIEIQPGHYRLEGYAFHITAPGRSEAPITLRAARLGDVVIESDMIETFKVDAPFWHFENLEMHGICGEHRYCEHAFHVVGAGSDAVFRNNRLQDYNAHFKINGENGRWPDHGLIEGNSLTETAPRYTTNPITPIDMVGASFWLITGNTITDFVRAGEGGATYGAFVKGAGEDNVMARNIVVCEWKLRGVPGQHVGLSLGGGGTGPGMGREQQSNGFEQIGGAIRDNLIAACSDDGIYLNRAARSVIEHNTLLDTAGIDGRFIETSAQVAGNIVDGVVRARDGATLRSYDNDTAWLLGLFVGLHPQRWMYRDVASWDLAWRNPPAPIPGSEPSTDLCGRRSSRPGAFDDYSACQ